MWRKTNDKRGLKPNRKIICRFCASKRTEMILRYSMAGPILETGGYACNMHYKCPACDFVAVFGVPIEKEYYERLIELRGGSEYIPLDEWDDCEVVKRKLEELGYW